MGKIWESKNFVVKYFGCILFAKPFAVGLQKIHGNLTTAN